MCYINKFDLCDWAEMYCVWCFSQISLSVTEELHIICFNTVFELKGFSVELQVKFTFTLSFNQGLTKSQHRDEPFIKDYVYCFNYGTVPESNLSFLTNYLLQASSFPVVIISNSSQQQSAWASVLWFNMLSQDPKVRLGHL